MRTSSVTVFAQMTKRKRCILSGRHLQKLQKPDPPRQKEIFIERVLPRIYKDTLHYYKRQAYKKSAVTRMQVCIAARYHRVLAGSAIAVGSSIENDCLLDRPITEVYGTSQEAMNDSCTNSFFSGEGCGSKIMSFHRLLFI